MKGIISGVLTKKQIDELFESESVLFYDNRSLYILRDVFSPYVIPEYRIIELFGSDFAEWIDGCIKPEGYMESGSDYNVCCYSESSRFKYFYQSGFAKIINEHNRRALIQSHEQSEAKKIIDKVYKRKCDKLRREDKEYERKMARQTKKHLQKEKEVAS